MKKIVSLLLAIMMLATLTACSTAASFNRGVWEDKTFTSEFSGISVTLPDDDWNISTDEELAELMGIGSEAYEDVNKLALELAKIKTVTDMGVDNGVTGTSVMVMYENLSLVANGKSYDEAKFADEMATALKDNTLYEYTIGDTYTTELCGKEYLVLPAQVAEYGLYQNYMLCREGNYMIEIIFTGFGEEGMDEAMSLFNN